MNNGMMEPGPSNDEYETPPWLYRSLDTEFGFTYDAASRLTPTVVLVGKQREEKHLIRPNRLLTRGSCDIVASVDAGEITPYDKVFCNPPYSLIDLFVEQALRTEALWVFLLPSRTGSDWYQRLQYASCCEKRPFRKRVPFLLDGVEQESPRFDSIVIVMEPKLRRGGVVLWPKKP